MIVSAVIAGFIAVRALSFFFGMGPEYYLYSAVFSLVPQLDYVLTFIYDKTLQ